MRVNLFRFHALLFFVPTIFFAIFFSGPVRAQALDPLADGLGYNDVLNRWGAPTSKVIQETRRVDIWTYPHGQVVFKQGKIRSWHSSRAMVAVNQDQDAATLPFEFDEDTHVEDSEVKEILDEIVGQAKAAENPAPKGAALLPGAVQPKIAIKK